MVAVDYSHPHPVQYSYGTSGGNVQQQQHLAALYQRATSLLYHDQVSGQPLEKPPVSIGMDHTMFLQQVAHEQITPSFYEGMSDAEAQAAVEEAAMKTADEEVRWRREEVMKPAFEAFFRQASENFAFAPDQPIREFIEQFNVAEAQVRSASA